MFHHPTSDKPSADFKPRLLRETAEIALTEVKRYVERHLNEDFSLRRVSAPLYLPVDSGLNDPGETVTFRLPGTSEELAIVRGLDCWLRTQLIRYDIAPGFGVFTVMNALRPEVRETATQSPHLTAWAWQQTIDPSFVSEEFLVETVKKFYKMLIATEEMVIEKLPHLSPTLPQRIHSMEVSELEKEHPDSSPERREYSYLHDNPQRSLLLISQSGQQIEGKLLVWNPYVKRPLTIIQIAIFPPSSVAPVTSIGGTILRDPLAMQILHQPHLLR